jgi:hypothetical protein
VRGERGGGGAGGAGAEIAAGRARKGRGRPGNFKSRRRRVLLGGTKELGRKERERKGMTGGVGALVREGGERTWAASLAGLAWEEVVGRHGGGGPIGDRGRLGLV